MTKWEITIRCTDDDHLSEETFSVSVDPNSTAGLDCGRWLQARLLQELMRRGYLTWWSQP